MIPRPPAAGTTGSRIYALGCIAAAWLSLLLLLNDLSGGQFRSAILFAVPVCLMSWESLSAAFVVAALAVTSAWLGGAMPSIDPGDSLAITALTAFVRLSAAGVVASFWSRVARSRIRGE